MTYPAIVLSFTFVLIAAVLIFIVPIFENMFKKPRRQNCRASPSSWSRPATNMWWIGPLILGAGISSTVFYKQKSRTSADFRLKVDKLKLRMPVFGSLFPQAGDKPLLRATWACCSTSACR